MYVLYYTRMIMNIIRPYLDFHMRKNQNGFRSRRTTTSHILSKETDRRSKGI